MRTLHPSLHVERAARLGIVGNYSSSRIIGFARPSDILPPPSDELFLLFQLVIDGKRTQTAVLFSASGAVSFEEIEASQRATAKVLGVTETTVARDLGKNRGATNVASPPPEAAD